MAILSIQLLTENLTPVNGKYPFTANFYDATTNQLLSDSKFPQNQVIELTSIPSSGNVTLPLKIADGVYPINNVKVKIAYKNKVDEYVVPNSTISCNTDCTAFPISSVSAVNNTTYTVTLSGASTQTYSWRLYNSSNPSTSILVGSGTANVNGSTFNITTQVLPAGKYLLELKGTSCKGKAVKTFTVSNTVPDCARNPTISTILTKSQTSLKFQFDALGVLGLAWRIKQGSTIVRQGVLKHTSIAQSGEPTFSDSTPTVTFNSIPLGNYTFEIQATTCTSPVSNVVAFTLEAPTEPLQFITGSPSVTGTSGNYSINIKINKTGSYNTVILNVNTGVYAQNGSISFVNNVAYVKSGLAAGTYLVKVGTLEVTVPIQDTSTGNCIHGPILSSITNSSPNTLQFLFDGNGVTAIAWRIKQGSNTVRNGIVNPTNNTPVITYPALSAGNYTLEIEGSNCNSQTYSKPFTIADTVETGNTLIISGYFGV